MSPLRWTQSTGPHWTVMLESVTPDTLTEVGGADGAGGRHNFSIKFSHIMSLVLYLLPQSLQ